MKPGSVGLEAQPRAGLGRRKARSRAGERGCEELLTPVLPSARKAREGGAGPWEELGLRAPQALPKLAGPGAGQEVRVKAQRREGEELPIRA